MAESVYIYQRGVQSKLVVALNLSNNTYESFKFGVDEVVTLREVLNSDSDIYGGSTPLSQISEIKAQKAEIGEHPYFVDISLSPFSAKIFEVINEKVMMNSLGSRKSEFRKRERGQHHRKSIHSRKN